MSQTVEEFTPSAAYSTAAAKPQESATPRQKDISASVDSGDHNHMVGGTSLMLTTAGGAAGAAFLGGTLAGPIGVVGGAAVGIILGFLIKKFTAQ
jgi:hypothetical protein